MGKFDFSVSRSFSNAYSEVAAHAGTFNGKPEHEALILLARKAEDSPLDSMVYITLPDGSCEAVDLRHHLPFSPPMGEETFHITLFDGENPATVKLRDHYMWRGLYMAAAYVAEEMGEPVARVILAAIAAIHFAQRFNGQARATPPAGFYQD